MILVIAEQRDGKLNRASWEAIAGAQQLAAGYEVRGTVRNLADGRVELLAEGDERELQDFLTGIEESQLGGFITEKQLKWSEPQNNLKGFKIVS